jgi:hypothetical protein
LHFGKTEIFFRKRLDRRPNTKSQTAPDGQITCVSKRSPEERSDIRGLRNPAWRCAYAGYSLRLSGRSNGKAYRSAISTFLLLMETPFNFIRAWALSARVEQNRCGYMPVAIIEPARGGVVGRAALTPLFARPFGGMPRQNLRRLRS